MRCGRARARAGAAALEDDDRLRARAAPQRVEEAPPVARALDVRADDARRRIVRQVVEEVRLGEVERVAVADDLAEAQAARRAVQHQLDGVVAALRDERDVAGVARQVGPEREPADESYTPMQFGPMMRMPASAAAAPSTSRSSAAACASPVSLKRPVKRCSAVTPFARALADQVEHAVGRDARDHEIDVAGDVRQRRVRRQAQDLRRARVDRVDRAREAEVDDRAQVVVARASRRSTTRRRWRRSAAETPTREPGSLIRRQST